MSDHNRLSVKENELLISTSKWMLSSVPSILQYLWLPPPSLYNSAILAFSRSLGSWLALLLDISWSTWPSPPPWLGLFCWPRSAWNLPDDSAYAISHIYNNPPQTYLSLVTWSSGGAISHVELSCPRFFVFCFFHLATSAHPPSPLRDFFTEVWAR